MALFQSTPPSREATGAPAAIQPSIAAFQSTPPSREATEACWNREGTDRHFNPRLPRGRRQISRFVPFGIGPISIHASLAGGDVVCYILDSINVGFQSTPPSREATVTDHVAPSEAINFNPRLPRGRRRGPRAICRRRRYFNPRLPRGRRPGQRGHAAVAQHISIHASLAGGDQSGAQLRSTPLHHFNPRLPRGRRRPSRVDAVLPAEFQSTPPSREATMQCQSRFFDGHEFQSTPPSREATPSTTGGGPGGPISIHASLAGGDCGANPVSSMAMNFNPRLPRGRRLWAFC